MAAVEAAAAQWRRLRQRSSGSNSMKVVAAAWQWQWQRGGCGGSMALGWQWRAARQQGSSGQHGGGDGRGSAAEATSLAAWQQRGIISGRTAAGSAAVALRQ